MTAYWQADYPSSTTKKSYVDHDETGRPVRMREWSAGNSILIWAINPDAWGMDKTVVGPAIYQPIQFAGQYADAETRTSLSDGVTQHRPGIVLNGYRSYDPFTGSYLQQDPKLRTTWSAYGYADNNPVGNSDRVGFEAQEICTEGHWEISGGDETEGVGARSLRQAHV